MFISNTVNIPLAIFTVVLRRFIDRLRYPAPQHPVVCRATSWLYNHPAIRPMLYCYLVIAVVRYVVRQMDATNLVKIVSSTATLISVKQSAPKTSKFYLKYPRRSHFLKNLRRNRSSHSKVLKYVASLVPSLPTVRRRRQICPKYTKHPYYDYNLSRYTLNSCREPKSIGNRSTDVPTNCCHRSLMSETGSFVSEEVNTILSPQECATSTLSSVSATTVDSMDTSYDDLPHHRHRNNALERELDVASIADSTEEPEDASQSETRREGNRSSATSEDDGHDSESDRRMYKRTRSGRIYENSIVTTRSRRRVK